MVTFQHFLAQRNISVEILQEVECHPATKQYGHSMILLVGRQVEICHLQGWVNEDLSAREWQMSVLTARQPLAQCCCQVSPSAVPSNCHSVRVHPELCLSHRQEVTRCFLTIIQLGRIPVLRG